MTESTLSESGDGSTHLPGVGRPHLFLLLECERPLGGSWRHALGDLDEVVIGRGDARSVARVGKRLTITVADPRMSVQHGRLRRSGGGWISRAGARAHSSQ